MSMFKYTKWLWVLLAVLLPIHNILIHFFVIKLGFSQLISFWKEGIVLLLVISMVAEIVFLIPGIIKDFKFKEYFFKFLPIFGFSIINFWILGLSFFYHNLSLKTILYGFRFELWWVWFFVITFTWFQILPKKFKNQIVEQKQSLIKSILTGFSILFAFVISELVIGTERLLSWFGFGSSPKFINPSPACHSLDFGINECRLSGGFPSPNHFSAYILLVLPLIIFYLITNYSKFIKDFFKFDTFRLGFKEFFSKRDVLIFLGSFYAIIFCILFIGFSFSRYSWIGLGLFFIFSFFGLACFGLKRFFGLDFSKIFKTLFSFSIISVFILSSALLSFDIEFVRSLDLPASIVKPSSSSLHIKHFNASKEVISNKNSTMVLGYGLGVSGPAAKVDYGSLEKNPLIQNYTNIAVKNYLPVERLVIPENWYLQLAINGGVFYAAAWVFIVLIPIWAFMKRFLQEKISLKSVSSGFFVLGFFATIIGNLFLHLWEQQTVALMWTIMWFGYSLILEDSEESSTIS